ncbi:MAG: DUF1592 domain-containing protein [Deltaproteobacteria bacterium]|nr:DUF1592 domain-containing protein [Deltaproteobacteria bacterium]
MAHARTSSPLVVLALLGLAIAPLVACTGNLDAGPRFGGASGDPNDPSDPSGPRDPSDPRTPAAPIPGDRTMRRITSAEYTQTVIDVLEIAPETPLPADLRTGGLSRQGAGSATSNTLAIEQYETAARDVARRAFSEPTRARRLLGCSPTGVADAICARSGVERLGARLFRRPLSVEESDRYTSLALDASTHTGTFDLGFALAVSGMLQSPRFLHHVEIGEATAEGSTRRRYTSIEMAARLASFVWNSIPDDTLLDAAASGALLTDDGLRLELARMLRDPRAERAMLSFLDEHLDVDHLEGGVPDEGSTAGIATRMREELHRVLAHAIFEAPETRWRDLFDADTTYVDAALADYYGLPAPGGSGYVATRVPDAQRGLLARGAVVASHGHGGNTSPTLRGLFVRTRLLCGVIAPPPAGVATTIESGSGATARERLARHATDPTCAGCHSRMDPIGLALEQIDARGLFRTHEGTALIDTAGELDGLPFEDAGSLGELMRDHPETDRCLVRHLFRSAVGRRESNAEEPTFSELPSEGMSVRDMLAHVITSEGFRTFEP